MNIPATKKERVFTDPPVTKRFRPRKDISAVEMLELKFHFLWPVFTAFLGTFFLLTFLMTTDTSGLTKTDQYFFLLISIITIAGVMFSMYMADLRALTNLFEEVEDQ